MKVNSKLEVQFLCGEGTLVEPEVLCKTKSSLDQVDEKISQFNPNKRSQPEIVDFSEIFSSDQSISIFNFEEEEGRKVVSSSPPSKTLQQLLTEPIPSRAPPKPLEFRGTNSPAQFVFNPKGHPDLNGLKGFRGGSLVPLPWSKDRSAEEVNKRLKQG